MRRQAVRAGLVMAGPVMLAGCAGTVPPPPPARAAPAPISTAPAALPRAGLERVLGRDAAALIALFGKPDADVSEGPGRKLQFAGAICVLDAYLYPRGSGGASIVTHIDARQTDGAPIDRASCIAALTRRGGGR